MAQDDGDQLDAAVAPSTPGLTGRSQKQLRQQRRSSPSSPSALPLPHVHENEPLPEPTSAFRPASPPRPAAPPSASLAAGSVNVVEAMTPPSSSSPSSGLWSGFAVGHLPRLLSTVREQSQTIANVYKRDLAEFVQVVQKETSAGVKAAARTVGMLAEPAVREVRAKPDAPEPAPATCRTGVDDGERGRLGHRTGLRSESTSPRGNLADRDSHVETSAADNKLGIESLFSLLAAKTSAAVDTLDAAAEALEDTALAKAGDFVHAATGKDPKQLLELATSGGNEIVSKIGTQFSGLLSSAVAVVPPEDIPVSPWKRKTDIIYDRRQAQLEALRSDTATFTTDLSISSDTDQRARFDNFAKSFRLSDHAAPISRISGESTELNKLLGRLVPNEISYDTFWLRYFFRVREFEREEDARKSLVQNVASAKNDDDFTWDIEDDEPESTDTDAAGTTDVAPKEATFLHGSDTLRKFPSSGRTHECGAASLAGQPAKANFPVEADRTPVASTKAELPAAPASNEPAPSMSISGSRSDSSSPVIIQPIRSGTSASSPNAAPRLSEDAMSDLDAVTQGAGCEPAEREVKNGIGTADDDDWSDWE